MTESNNNITVGMGFKYPGILGDYSSMDVHVSMTIPADTQNLTDQESLAAVVDPYRDVVGEYVMRTLNDACRQVGKEAPFGEME